MLSRRLPQLRNYLPVSCQRVLELGAGTGLVGIAAACLWKMEVLLTDLSEIIPNLEQNLDRNRHLIERNGGRAGARALDWADTRDMPKRDDDKFLAVLAADPIYSSEHPRLLVAALRRWIRNEPEARFIVELPLRERYDQERADLRHRLCSGSFELVDEGTEKGYDDWQRTDGSPAEVECWWSVWKPSL